MPKAKAKSPPRGKKKRKTSGKPRVKRSYRDHERMAAMALADQIGPQAASEALNIPYATIAAWRGGWRTEGALQMYNEGRFQLADIYEKAAWETLCLARDTAHAAPFRDLMRGSALATDKMLVLRGKPTHIGASANTTQNLDPIAALIAAAKPEELDTLMRLMERATGARNANAISIDGSADSVGEAGAGTAGGVHPVLLANPEPRS